MPVLLNQPGVGPERALPSYWCCPSVIGLTLRHEAVGVAELTPLCWGPWSNVRCARNRPVPGIIWMLWRKETLTGGDDPIRACR